MKRLTTILLTFVLALSAAVGGMTYAVAAEAEREFDASPVLYDLKDSTTASGETFDLTDYPYDTDGKLRLVALVEYCYSYAANQRDNYALYLYIYNPAGAEIDGASALNEAQMAVAYGSDGEPTRWEGFRLAFCNKSTGDYNNLFYKFRVIDHESADGKTISERVNSNARRYDLSGVELQMPSTSNPEEYSEYVAGTYTYTGYAAGYGPDAEAESTLTCTAEPLDVIRIDEVGTTYYNFPKTQTKATQVQTVWFALERSYDFLDETDELYALEAEFYKYLTAPMFVTENSDIYSYLSDWVGVDIGTLGNAENKYAIYTQDFALHPAAIAGAGIAGGVVGGILGSLFKNAGIVYNAASLPWNVSETEESNFVTKLAYLFSTDGNGVDDYGLPREKIESWWNSYTSSHGSGSVYNGYNDDLFMPYDLDGDGVSDEAYNRISPTIEDDFDVPGMGYEGSFGWLGEWAASMGLIDRFEGVADIDVIREVTAEDMQDTTGLSQRLYIAASDVQEFTDFYREQAAQGKRVYLLRYDSSEYVAADVIVNPKGMASADRTSTEMRQMFVNLGFDFISFTFKDAEGALTVVPAAMSPVDGVPDADPSREPTEALERARKTGIIVLVIVIVILLIVGVCLLFGYFGGFPLAAMGGGKSGDVKVTVNNGGGRGSGGKSADASTAAKRAESAAKRAEKSASAAKQSAKKIKQTEVNRRAKTTATQKSKSSQGKGTGAGGRSRSGVAKGGKSNGKARTRKN